MVSWLLVIILAYLFFAFSSLGDKVVLSGPPNPKSYTFYVGLLNILILFVIPFTGLENPGLTMMCWIIFDAIVFVLGLYSGFLAVDNFEVSKVTTTIGATQPIFIFFISWFFWGYQELTFVNFIAFFLLFIGSLVISFGKKPELTGKFLKITAFSSLMYSVDYVLAKFIFANFSFVQGLIWRSIFIFLLVLVLLLKKENRRQIFKKKIRENKKLEKLFLATQTCGGVANILQSFAIYLTPIAFLPIINSLRGMQFVFLFVITITVSFFFPKILKEEISKKIILRKSFAIILIILGLGLLVF
jgi:drug/metabolite transporter (DMT)-like permease